MVPGPSSHAVMTDVEKNNEMTVEVMAFVEVARKIVNRHLKSMHPHVSHGKNYKITKASLL